MQTEVKATPWDKLTQRQRDVVNAFLSHTTEHGSPPAIRELMAALELSSPNGVCNHLEALEGHGWLCRNTDSKSRYWRLTPHAMAHFRGVRATDEGIFVNLLTPQLMLTAAEARTLAGQLNRAAYIAEGRRP